MVRMEEVVVTVGIMESLICIVIIEIIKFARLCGTKINFTATSIFSSFLYGQNQEGLKKSLKKGLKRASLRLSF